MEALSLRPAGSSTQPAAMRHSPAVAVEPVRRVRLCEERPNLGGGRGSGCKRGLRLGRHITQAVAGAQAKEVNASRPSNLMCRLVRDAASNHHEPACTVAWGTCPTLLWCAHVNSRSSGHRLPCLHRLMQAAAGLPACVAPKCSTCNPGARRAQGCGSNAKMATTVTSI